MEMGKVMVFWAQLDWWIIVGDLDDVQGIGRISDLKQK